MSLADTPPSGNGLKSSATVVNMSLSQPPSSTMLWPTAFQPADETRPPKKAFVKFHPQLLFASEIASVPIPSKADPDETDPESRRQDFSFHAASKPPLRQ